MKLWLFGTWCGYVGIEYYAIAADTEEEAHEYLRPLVKDVLDKRETGVTYVNDMVASVDLPITKKGHIKELSFVYAE